MNKDIEDSICKDYIEGLNVYEMYSKYKVCGNVLYKILRERNIKKRNLSKEDYVRVCDMYLEGSDLDSILKEFNIKNTQLYRILKKNNIKTNRSSHPDLDGTERCTECGTILTKETKRSGNWYICKVCYPEEKYRLMNRYGITEKEHDSLFERANNKCEICGTKEDLCVDHNHITDKVRGLLCRKCNCAIGLLQDSVNLVRKAVEYLESR